MKVLINKADNNKPVTQTVIKYAKLKKMIHKLERVKEERG